MKINTRRIPTGYSLSAVMSLAAIYDAGKKPTRPTDIANYVGISTAAITGTLDRLEKEGLVRRRLSTTDRRSFEVNLTEAGLAFCENLKPAR